MANASDLPKQPSMQDILRLAQSPEGQKIIAFLKNSQDPNIQSAMMKAMQGDYAPAKEVLSELLSGEEIQGLLRHLGGK